MTAVLRDGYQAHHLHTRYVDHSGVRDTAEGSHPRHNLPRGESRFCDQFPQILTRTEIIEFLGFLVDSNAMELKRPGDKLKSFRGEAKRILTSEYTTALELSRMLGKMNATTKATEIAPLFYRQVQAELQLAL